MAMMLPESSDCPQTADLGLGYHAMLRQLARWHRTMHTCRHYSHRSSGTKSDFLWKISRAKLRCTRIKAIDVVECARPTLKGPCRFRATTSPMLSRTETGPAIKWLSMNDMVETMVSPFLSSRLRTSQKLAAKATHKLQLIVQSCWHSHPDCSRLRSYHTKRVEPAIVLGVLSAITTTQRPDQIYLLMLSVLLRH